jgi:glycosyltransferase involved in cell wall biosynthesis
MAHPFFSIAIPTYGYNGKGVEFLEHNLTIIESQTFKDFEVIISDHSTDDTILAIFNKWSDRLNIKYFRNENGRGIISPNINNAMRQCTGKWIKVLFQDDFLFDENALKIQYQFINFNSEIKWLMTAFHHSNDGVTYYNAFIPRWNNLIWTGYNTMGCPSGLTMKNESLIFFDEGLNWLMDVDYYKQLFDRYGEPKILNDFTVVNRTWGNRLTDKEEKMVYLKYGK